MREQLIPNYNEEWQIFGQFLDAEPFWTYFDDIFGHHWTSDWTGFDKCPNITSLVFMPAAQGCHQPQERQADGALVKNAAMTI